MARELLFWGFLFTLIGLLVDTQLSVEGATLRHPFEFGTREGRLKALVDANIIATHAYQVGLAAERPGSDSECFDSSGLSLQELDRLVALQQDLLNANLEEISAWMGFI